MSILGSNIVDTSQPCSENNGTVDEAGSITSPKMETPTPALQKNMSLQVSLEDVDTVIVTHDCKSLANDDNDKTNCLEIRLVLVKRDIWL